MPGLIGLVTSGDSLAGENGENINKIKLYAWLGPTKVKDPKQDVAGVGWMLAENWWPASLVCYAAICWLCIWPLNLFTCRRRGANTIYW